MLVDKEMLLQAYKNIAQKGLLDKDVLLVKLQSLYDNNHDELTIEDVQPIVDIIQGVVTVVE